MAKRKNPFEGFTYEQVVEQLEKFNLKFATPKQISTDSRWEVRDLSRYIDSKNWRDRLQQDSYIISNTVDYSQMSLEALSIYIDKKNFAGKTIGQFRENAERLVEFLERPKNKNLLERLYSKNILARTPSNQRRKATRLWTQLNGGKKAYVRKYFGGSDDAYPIGPITPRLREELRE